MTDRILYRVAHGMKLSPIAYTSKAAKAALNEEWLTDEQRARIEKLYNEIVEIENNAK